MFEKVTAKVVKRGGGGDIAYTHGNIVYVSELGAGRGGVKLRPTERICTCWCWEGRRGRKGGEGVTLRSTDMVFFYCFKHHTRYLVREL